MNAHRIVDAILEVAVVHAQKLSQEKGIAIGATVAHPSDPFSYELLSTDGNIASVGRRLSVMPFEVYDQKEFPFNELFDVEIAEKFLAELKKATVSVAFDAGGATITLQTNCGSNCT